MGFLGGAGMAGAAGGANQALQNFLNFYMQNKELSQRKKLEEDRLKIQQSEEARRVTAEKERLFNMQGFRSAVAGADRGPAMSAEDMAFAPGAIEGGGGAGPAMLTPQGQGMMEGGMDYGKAMTDVIPFLDKDTSPQFTALKTIRELPLEEQKTALANLVALSGISRNRAQEAKALRPEKPDKEKNLNFKTETKAVGNLTFSREVGRDQETGEIKYKGDWGSEPSARERPEPDTEGKDQLKLSRAQQMAMRDLRAKYNFDSFMGSWSKNGQPILAETVEKEYQALIKKYYEGSGGTNVPRMTQKDDPLGIR